jgi:hypothetical protein
MTLSISKPTFIWKFWIDPLNQTFFEFFLTISKNFVVLVFFFQNLIIQSVLYFRISSKFSGSEVQITYELKYFGSYIIFY